MLGAVWDIVFARATPPARLSIGRFSAALLLGGATASNHRSRSAVYTSFARGTLRETPPKAGPFELCAPVSLGAEEMDT
jgi:hypothetical protein